MNCLDCKYVTLELPHPVNPIYKCKRFPPQHDFSVPAPNRMALYPTVKDGYWCGEYMPKKVVLSVDAPIECDDSVRVVRQRGRPKKLVSAA